MSAATKESRDIKNRIRQLGDVNVGAIKEYKEVSERYEFLTEQRADITTAMNELKTIINDMDRTIREKFIVLKDIQDFIEEPKIKSLLQMIAQRRLYDLEYNTTVIIV